MFALLNVSPGSFLSFYHDFHAHVFCSLLIFLFLLLQATDLGPNSDCTVLQSDRRNYSYKLPRQVFTALELPRCSLLSPFHSLVLHPLRRHRVLFGSDLLCLVVAPSPPTLVWAIFFLDSLGFMQDYCAAYKLQFCKWRRAKWASLWAGSVEVGMMPALCVR